MNRSSIVILASLLLAAGAAKAQSCQLSGLQFMQGVWRASDKASATEERWVVAPGGRLMGSSWELHADGPGGVIEAEAITADDNVVSLRIRHFSSTLGQAREEKDAPMTFTASRCAAGEVVFDGQGPQSGEHMTYRRSGDVMTFTGDFIHQGQPIQVTQQFRRAGD